MNVLPIKGQSVIKIGQGIDVHLEDGTVVEKSLMPGEIFSGEIETIGFIREKEYTLSIDKVKTKKTFPLDGYQIRCVIRDNKVIPVLRDAKGKEKSVFRYFKKGVWENTYEGISCPFWPTIEKIK